MLVGLPPLEHVRHAAGYDGERPATSRCSGPSKVNSYDGVASASPTIFAGIQDRLGLRLESTRRTVDVLVVDSAEKPAAD